MIYRRVSILVITVFVLLQGYRHWNSQQVEAPAASPCEIQFPENHN